MPRLLLQILVAIALVLAANYYWKPQTSHSPDEDTQARQKDLPKSYIWQTRAWSFDENGELTDILEAERVEQFARGSVSLLTNPRFYAHSGDDRTWSAVAARGRFEEHSQRLLLRKNVELTHDQTGTQMQTNALDIEVDEKIATSRKTVTIIQENNRTTADGMVARMNEETITLKPNVESTYEQLP
ncbi:LPS export ABC transporter periplasmic protein LptC [Pseudohalioglobus lutimaris]|uniref:LPS export ABC transporter periplasmic protein LptC n=1 Tax=Pseudohalioglobus lutimaris TaxID=1737061 RepID=A0A2N5X684_9GAMM|nr:LPS export ABC transporter periplasmic protein LptC [Pseudohalioglobus lutimaris]PLW69988.1 LPS export ABC transporter periplasmic protein LptC [Pseudohalioglobus lutimaris]